MDELKIEDVEKALDDLLDVQCADGNWNHDAYMHGMANGLILAKSLFSNKRPEFLDAPKVWGEDIKTEYVVEPLSETTENV